MKNLRIVLSLILAISFLLAGCGLDIEDEPVSVSGDLAYYADMDADSLEEACEGNYIEVSGTVDLIYKNIGKVYLGNSLSDRVEFSCDLSNADDALEIEEGDLVVVRGKCSSCIGSTLYLKNCEIEKHTGETESESLLNQSTSTTDLTVITTTTTTATTHIHSFNAATCIAPKTCACGATEGSALGHSWKSATYSAPKTCKRCGVTEGNSLPVPGGENYHGHVYTGGEYSKKYHYEAHCAGKKSHEITWEEVERRGLEPCGTCVLK